MKWTNELPTVAGWYWVKIGDAPKRIVEIKTIHATYVKASGKFNCQSFHKSRVWKFSGPIPEPQEE